MLTFAVPSLNKREHSSAGSEHLPYKQRVRGSNPFAPTKMKTTLGRLFCFYTQRFTEVAEPADGCPKVGPV